MYVCMYVCMCVCVCACMCVHIRRQAAEYVLSHLPPRFKAVCYYQQGQGWMIWDRAGRCLPRHSAPVAEKEVCVSC